VRPSIEMGWHILVFDKNKLALEATTSERRPYENILVYPLTGDFH